MKVNNVNGISQAACGCGSWLDHWKSFSGQAVPVYCPEHSCHERDLIGVPVKRADSGDNGWYIIPLCKEHSKATGTLNVTSACELVSADVSRTCGRVPART